MSVSFKVLPTALDLFAGAGGTGLGFRLAGFRLVGAVEAGEFAAATYRANIGASVYCGNIRNLDPAVYRRSLGLEIGELSVLIGCPPCQGFSRLRNGGGAGDERNELVLHYLEFVREFRPRFAVFENVPGFLKTRHGREFYEALLDGLRDAGYGITAREVNAADYGVPQIRWRVIVLAGRDGDVPPFPWETHAPPDSPLVETGFRQPWVTVRRAIGHMTGPSAALLPNQVSGVLGERVSGFIKRVPKDGGSRTQVDYEHWLPCHRKHGGHKDVYGRLSWDKPAPTITTGCNNPSKGRFVHPEEDRGLTHREAAALQGFPDDFRFEGQKIAEQIGNAVPPPLAQAIAKSLRDRLPSGASVSLEAFREQRSVPAASGGS